MRVHVVMVLADVLVTVCDTGYWQFECAGNWRYNCFEIVILVPPICCTPVPSLPLPAGERLPRWPPSPAAAPAADPPVAKAPLVRGSMYVYIYMYTYVCFLCVCVCAFAFVSARCL